MLALIISHMVDHDFLCGWDSMISILSLDLHLDLHYTYTGLCNL